MITFILTFRSPVNLLLCCGLKSRSSNEIEFIYCSVDIGQNHSGQSPQGERECGGQITPFFCGRGTVKFVTVEYPEWIGMIQRINNKIYIYTWCHNSHLMYLKSQFFLPCLKSSLESVQVVTFSQLSLFTVSTVFLQIFFFNNVLCVRGVSKFIFTGYCGWKIKQWSLPTLLYQLNCIDLKYVFWTIEMKFVWYKLPETQDASLFCKYRVILLLLHSYTQKHMTSTPFSNTAPILWSNFKMYEKF